MVALSVAPDLASVTPPTLSIPAGQLDGTFSVTAGANTGGAELLASLGGQVIRLPFQVTMSVTRPPSAPGDLIIVEVLRNPSGSADEKVREWFEVFNPTPDSIAIDGLTVIDNVAGGHRFSGGVVIPPGAHAVFAYSADPAVNGGISGAIAYGAADIQLANGTDRITLTINGTTIDEVSWAGSWPGATNGVAMCLRAPYTTNNDLPAAWGDSVGTFGPTGDRGHPGQPSTAANCP
jgi:hypothetical protein